MKCVFQAGERGVTIPKGGISLDGVCRLPTRSLGFSAAGRLVVVDEGPAESISSSEKVDVNSVLESCTDCDPGPPISSRKSNALAVGIC